MTLVGVLCVPGCSGSDAATEVHPTWTNDRVNAVSRTTVAAGVAATTSLTAGGSLETVAVDLVSGEKLWGAPATLAGRLPGMGVSPPAAVPTGAGRGVVASVDPVKADPVKKGRWRATLVARDARTGRQTWTRPVHSTFGPQRCGPYLCLSEHTALSSARMVVLDPATGRTLWRLSGIAEVEWADDTRVVLMRLAEHPVVEAYEAKTGKRLWRQPVAQALGPGVDLSGGWSFGAVGDNLVGYVAPYTSPGSKKTSTFGVFSMKIADGTVNWMRPSVVRVYPSGSPGHAPVVRPVDGQGQYGGFARLDAETGRVLGQIGAAEVPGSGWWLAFPQRMDRIGFLKHDQPGTVYNLTSGKAVPAKEQRGWSFCVTDPKPLGIKGQPTGFYSVAAVCEYDLATGKRVAGTTGAPPTWYTGGQDGWRLWRDDRGALHAVKDGTTTVPGMYG
ncbi:hypothetical protein Misp01_24530 [Microtetraspora sp. NBRC 13810]|uniref:outer membrane protein assembly factor BamB family protein n=1 Tax=Microtetraspora sp. NBRC 13810 TaxID=3030990 RepID=UPI0024A1B325|nr:PQQ-binding-like beta-propeller repeat protein [Microtetraspora sp. NBRC 13810]GLW07323.1 hypothetical protein Misp01_24530 [Microtetraspora sp. NBRC 13810]